MSLPSLSVVMANYNHARFLLESLEALARQSWPAREILVVDDASTDDSVRVVEDLSRRYPAIRLLRNERNLGAALSFRRGAEQARGDCLFFPAADDRVLPGFFEKSLALLDRYPQAGLCSALAALIGLNGEDLGPCRTPAPLDAPGYLSPAAARKAFERRGNWVVTYSAIYRREAYRELGGHDPALGPTCDGLLNFVIPLRHGACFIPERLVLWRKSDAGYALKSSADWTSGLAVIEGLERRLAAPDLAGLFTPRWLAVWKRQALRTFLYELDRRGAAGPEELAAAVLRLSDGRAADRLYAAALRRLPSAARGLTKAYLLSQRPPAELWRDALGRLGAA
ncbi:MAG: glycosyltransferase family 2 protein [Elusimicrobia bacterium]|nr:glycosyltransferase family 2 protein [Elusimicrobiota bacterium]